MASRHAGRNRGIVAGAASRRIAVLGATAFVLVAVLAAAAPAEAAKQGTGRCAGKQADHVVDPKRGFAGSSARGEVIIGSHKGDRIRGRKGRDHFCGRKGADRISGGAGPDVLRGGKGRDTIRGGRGRDRINAVDGERDRIFGGRGRDTIHARDGARDTIDCGPGRDTARIDNLDVLRRCERVRLGGTPDFSLPSWSDGLWSDPSSYETIQTGDITGDGIDELVGRSPFGIEAHRFDSETGQWIPLYVGADPKLSDTEGWLDPQYHSTIQLGDLDGDGTDELLARDKDGVAAWDYNPESQSWTALPTNTDLSDSESWDQAEYYTTIQTGDIDGDGRQELLARAYAGMDAWKLTGDSWEKLSATGRPFTDEGGWKFPQYYSTIQAADIDGDGADEVIGRDDGGLVEYKFANGGWTALPPLGKFPDDPWQAPQYYSTIQTGDLVGDGKAEVFARAPDGLHAYTLEGGDWSELPELGVFTDAGGWNKAQYYSTIQTARLLPFEGPAIDFVIARGVGGLQAYWVPGGEDWEPYPVLGDLSDAAGWNSERYYSTIQTANGIEAKGADAIVARGLTGVNSYGYDPQRRAWGTFSGEFPAFAGEEAAAYGAINAYIGGQDNPRFDLRQAYPDALNADFDAWRQDLEQMPQPSGVSDQSWEAVEGQLDKELQNGKLVLSWYDDASAGGYLHSLIDDKFEGLSMDTSADLLKFDAESNAELVLQEWETFEGFLEGLGGLDVIDPGGDLIDVTAQLVGGATTAGLGASGVDAAIDGIEADYIALRNRLNSDFQTALKGIGQAKVEIQGDYGLQTAVGGLIGSNLWKPLTGDARATALAMAERSYDISAWQTITPGIWVAFQIPPEEVGNWCDVDDNYPSGYCIWRPPDDSAWTLAYTTTTSGCDFRGGLEGGPCNPVQKSLTDTLFGKTSQSCQQVWDLSTCSLGQSYADVFLGQGGWRNLPARQCTHSGREADMLACPVTRP
jgi:hypothetical protein